MISSSFNLCCIISEISAISIKASRNIQTKNEIPRATSDDFTNEEMKNAIPKKALESEKSNPVYKKKILHGIAAPFIKPKTIAIIMAKRTGRYTVINLPMILPQ
jgi:hypothetical protein